jgi:biotin carboxyl carrier protein
VKYEVHIGGRPVNVDTDDLGACDIAWPDERTASFIVAGRSYTFGIEPGTVVVAGHEFAVEVQDPRRLLTQSRREQAGRARIKAPMAGKVVKLLAAVGDQVESGQPILVLEAMKMQNEVRAPKSGTLVSLHPNSGSTVATGELLAEID